MRNKLLLVSLCGLLAVLLTSCPPAAGPAFTFSGMFRGVFNDRGTLTIEADLTQAGAGVGATVTGTITWSTPPPPPPREQGSDRAIAITGVSATVIAPGVAEGMTGPPPIRAPGAGEVRIVQEEPVTLVLTLEGDLVVATPFLGSEARFLERQP